MLKATSILNRDKIALVTAMHKHATASVFLFTRQTGTWRIGLIRHPRLHRWMLPGGHVEPHENPAETALREVREETGSTAELVNTHVGGLTEAAPGVPVPVWIAEQHVPAERRHPHPHIHVDHLYIAVASGHEPTTPAELPFHWFNPSDLAGLDMFDDSRRSAHLLFDRIDDFPALIGAQTTHNLEKLRNDWQWTLTFGDPKLRAVAINRVLGLADDADPGEKHWQVHEDGRTPVELAAAYQAVYLQLEAKRAAAQHG